MKIFISANSKEFKECREGLAKDLRMAGHDPLFQDEFTHDPEKTIIQILEKLVGECDLFIALVGNVYGEEPLTQPPEHRRSYTQWEYFFACGESFSGQKARGEAGFIREYFFACIRWFIGKKTGEKPRFIFFAQPAFLDDQARKDALLREVLAEEAKTGSKSRQEEFKIEIKRSGRLRGKLVNVNQLSRDVLVGISKMNERQPLIKVVIQLSCDVLASASRMMHRRPTLIVPLFVIIASTILALIAFRPPTATLPTLKFSDVPGGEVLNLIYTSNAPAGPKDAPKPELQCSVFECQQTANALSLLQNGDMLTSVNDNFCLGLHCLSPGYLYVFTIGSSGKLKWLSGPNLENFSSVTNPVAANQTIVLPNSPYFHFFADPIIGTEHFYVVYCQSRWEELEKRLAAAEGASAISPGKSWPRNFEFFTRGVKGSFPAANATVIQFLNSQRLEAPITSQPVQATNTHLVIERWFQHEGK